MCEAELFFFTQLDERQKRLYAGLKSSNLGYHGVNKISIELGIHPHTIRQGQKELTSQKVLPNNSVRKEGAGRKKKSKMTRL